MRLDEPQLLVRRARNLGEDVRRVGVADLRCRIDVGAHRLAELREHRGNRAATARALGIGRRTLYTKMEKLGLVPSWGSPITMRRAMPRCASMRPQAVGGSRGSQLSEK